MSKQTQTMTGDDIHDGETVQLVISAFVVHSRASSFGECGVDSGGERL